MEETDQLESNLLEIAQPIGELVIAFADLEDTLNRSLVESIDQHDADAGWLIIRKMPYSEKVGLYYDLNYRFLNLCACDHKYIDLLDVLLSDLKQAGANRNDIVHAAWYDWDINSNKVKTKTKAKRGELHNIEIKIDKKMIFDAIDFIYTISERLYEFNEDKWDWIRTQ